MTGATLWVETMRLVDAARKSVRVSQSLVILSSQVIALATGFVASILTARMLGPSGFGDFSLTMTVWAMAALVLNPGYVSSGTRLLAELPQDEWSELTGVILGIALATGGAIAAATFLLAGALDKLIRSDIAGPLMLLAPLSFVFAVQPALALIFQSTNRPYYLFAVYAVPSTLTLLGVVGLMLSSTGNVSTVLLVELLSLVLVMVPLCFGVHPSLNRARHWLRRIGDENRRYGFPVYTGTVAGVVTSYLSRFLLSYFQNSAAVGMFSLAVQVTDPLKLIPNALATASFRDFAKQSRMSRRMLLGAGVLTVSVLLVALIMYRWALPVVYSSKFAQAGPLAMVVSSGAIAIGFGDLFNRFLGAHGLGKELRNAALLVGAVNLLGYGLLIPLLGLWGAPLTALLAGFAYAGAMIVSYRDLANGAARGSSEALA